MADLIITKKEDMIAIADTVRTKGGSNSQMPLRGIISGINGIEPVLQEKTISPSTLTQSVISDNGYDGLSVVTVEGDENLIPENIALGIDIFGVTGTLKGGGGSGTSSSVSADRNDINFIDYDGTILYAYTLEEVQALSELPELPTHDGLVCQGWNWTLDDIKAINNVVDVGATYITDDGATRIYIRLSDGRTSPMLGVCPNGTVTVDWGDGTSPDTLTGTSIYSVKWTPTHNYAESGEYVIRLSVEGSMGFYGTSSSNTNSSILRYSKEADNINKVYQNSVQRIEIGDGVTNIYDRAFQNCYSLSNIVIPSSVTKIGEYVFQNCYSLSNIVIPNSVTSIDDNAFDGCYGLSNIVIPNSVTSIGESVLCACYSLSNIVIPSSVTSIGISSFNICYNLSNIVIPNSVTSIGEYAFYNCHSLPNIVIPSGVTSIDEYTFYNCRSLSNIVIPSGVTSIDKYVFYNCTGIKYYDFTKHTAVPTLSSTTAFTGIPADCEIRVPASLIDEWKAATNWSNYADKIVGV